MWTSSLLQRATEDIIRDTTSRSLATQLELRLLGHHRISAFAAADPSLLYARSEFVEDVHDLLERIEAMATTDEEQVLVARIRRDVLAYRRERDRVQGLDLSPEAAQQESEAELERAVASVGELRRINGEAVHRAQVEARRVSFLTTIAGAAAAILLFAGLLIVVVGARRFVISPLIALENAIRHFRRTGDTDVRAAPRGSSELREVSEGFNELITALARQREARLAYTAGIVHDLRNPLAALNMGLEVAKSDPSESTRSRMLSMVERQVGRLARMVDDLLDSARVEAGHLELHRERIDLRTTVHDMIDLYAPSAPSHHIVLDLAPQPVPVDADPVRMEQVLGNLLSNAIKYSPNGGRIDVRVRSTGREGIVEVQDEGVGIPKDRMEDLFTPFQRIDASGAPGAGLGLSVVHRIVDAHGGRIEVESAVRRGSTFRVLLPLAR